MHQWERRKVREVDGLLAAERTAAAAAVFVVGVIVAAVEGDDDRGTEREAKEKRCVNDSLFAL